eukprot:213090_1
MVKDINEILKQGMCCRLKIFQEDTNCQARLALAKVFGVGPKKAKSLISKGVMSLEQLRQREDLLTKEMKIGLKYIEDLQHRIPRSEVERIGSFIQSEMQALRTGGSYEVVGSYRRGEPYCGDVDILLSPRSGESCAGILSTLLRRLKSIGFISDTLKSPSLRKSERRQTWLGICRLPDPVSLHRRVDIKVYSRSQLPFAKLYFTGSSVFNRSMRMKAKKKGLILTDHGLYKRTLVANGKVRAHNCNECCFRHYMQASNGKIIFEPKQSIRGTSKACEMEEDVFNALESPYIPPHERVV